jgi:hypothetical protein
MPLCIACRLIAARPLRARRSVIRRRLTWSGCCARSRIDIGSDPEHARTRCRAGLRVRVHGELGLTQQNISYHLKQLADAGVIAR